MKGKLIKTEKDLYKLLYITENTIVEHNELFDGKLSFNNCQAIERGYDLDKLVENYLTIFATRKSDPDRNFVRMGMEEGFKEGFQKALEILGDKKFSTVTIRYLLIELILLKKEENEDTEVFKNRQLDFVENKIKSLQQTEWDVEIEMEPYAKYVNLSNQYVYTPLSEKPKLDSNGCLILKRIDDE